MPQNIVQTQIIAHRGASHQAPENTLAAVHLAWKEEADAVEVDVQFSKDGEIVVIHDDNTRRTAGGRKKIAEQTLAELRTLDAGAWKAANWAGEKIPTLSELFAAVPTGKRVFVEIKCGSGCIPRFAEVFRRSGLSCAQVVPIGFSLETMQKLKKALPELEVCWVVEFKRTLQGWTPTAEKLIAQVQQAGLDGLDLSGQGPVNGAFALQVHQARLKLYIWTVDSPALARKLIQAGVDGITTNKPGRLREQLQVG